MGQKVRPLGFRLGIVEDWRSRWYANKREFGKLLVQDAKLRRYVKNEFAFAGITKVEIERTDKITVRLHCARPGLVIGRKGAKVDKLREDLTHLTGREVSVDIVEIKRPEMEAQLVAEEVSQQLVRRSPFRRAVKRAVEMTMGAGAKGCKIRVAGRLGGAELARSETWHQGSIPLNTLRARISYGTDTARTRLGAIGVKVWIYTGDVSGEDAEVTHGADAQAG